MKQQQKKILNSLDLKINEINNDLIHCNKQEINLYSYLHERTNTNNFDGLVHDWSKFPFQFQSFPNDLPIEILKNITSFKPQCHITFIKMTGLIHVAVIYNLNVQQEQNDNYNLVSDEYGGIHNKLLKFIIDEIKNTKQLILLNILLLVLVDNDCHTDLKINLVDMFNFIIMNMIKILYVISRI